MHIHEHVPDRPEAPIFSASDGSMVRLSNWRHRIWQRGAEKAGLPSSSTPYVLRHTAASLMAQQGVPVSTAAAAAAAAAALGHDPAIYLRTYAHLYPGDLRSAAHAMDAARAAARTEKLKVPADITRTAKAKRREMLPVVVPDSRGIPRGWEIQRTSQRRPPAPELRFSGGGKGIRTPDLLTARRIRALFPSRL